MQLNNALIRFFPNKNNNQKVVEEQAV